MSSAIEGLASNLVSAAAASVSTVLFSSCLIVDLVLTERHVAHCQIVEITAVGGLKACHSNVSLRVQFFRNAPGDAVQFHAIQPTVLHADAPPADRTHILGRR